MLKSTFLLYFLPLLLTHLLFSSSASLTFGDILRRTRFTNILYLSNHNLNFKSFEDLTKFKSDLQHRMRISSRGRNLATVSRTLEKLSRRMEMRLRSRRKLITCDATCYTCSGTASTCTSCSGLRYLAGSFCYTTCPTPLYAVFATNTCDLECPFERFKYDVDRTCDLICPNPFIRNIETGYCVDTCPDGMFSSNAACFWCSSDCLTCSFYSNCLSCKNDWILTGTSCLPPSNVYQRDFQLDSGGFSSHTFVVNGAYLSSNHIYKCGPNRILGGPNDFGQGTSLSKAYTNVVSHYKIRISFTFIKIDYWDSKTAFLYLNTNPEVLIDSKTFTPNQNYIFIHCGTANIPEGFNYFDVFVDHFSSNIEFKITTNLDVASSVASWGICDCKLHVYRCHETCLTCSGKLSNQCDTCYPDATKNANNECVCNNHFYSVTVPTNTCTVPPCTVCTSCHSDCNNCDGGSNKNCIDCLSPRLLVNKQCVCPTPYYGTGGTCDLQCPSGQFKYDFDRTCYATCPNPSFANPETEFCVDPCPDGMFKNIGKGKCTLCDFDCQTCSISASSCLTCKNDWIKSGTFCLPPSNVYQVDFQLDSAFTSHTFLVNNADLLTDHSSYCGSYHILGGPNDFGQNTYISKTYTNIVSHYRIRIRFFFLKIDFWDSKTVSLYLNTNPEVLIESKTFISNQDSSLNLICGTGSTPEALRQFDVFVDHFSSSIELKITTNLDIASSVASWGIFKYKLYVYRCHETCLTCSGKLSNQCDTCYPDATKNANNECVCNNHFYSVTVPANTCTVPPCTVCTSCHSDCNNCDGGANTDCIDCSSPRFLLNKQCYLVCPTPYFGTSDNICHDGACIAHSYLDETDGVCKSCHFDCDNCSGPLNTNCLSCLPPYFLLIKDGLMKCVENCGNGFVGDAVKRICLTCEASCQTCNDVTKNNCLTCLFPRYFFQNQCLTSCPSNYYGNNATLACENACPPKTYIEQTVATCWPCSLECKICSGLSRDECLECEPNYYLQKTSCVSNCFNGFYEVKNSMKCEPCLTDCTKCINSTICEVCNGNKYLLMPESKKCVNCLEEGYYLEENICYLCESNCKICEDKAKCMECLSGYFQYKGKCIVQEKISATLSKDSTIPNRFYLNFNKKWSNEFQFINSNIKFNITDINPDDFSYKVYSNPSVENNFIIDLTFKKDVPQGKELTISFNNLTTNVQFSLEKKDISLPLNEFHVCSKGMRYNLELKSCLNITNIRATLDYTILSNEITLSFDKKFNSFWNILPQNSNFTIENLNFTYEFSLKDNNTYLIRFNFNKSFTNKPLCTVYLNVPENLLYEANNSFHVKENPIMINLKDYYLLSAQIKDAMQTKKQVSSKISSLVASTTMINNALSFGSSFAFIAMMSMDVIRFLKFIEIDYPPNVEDMFQCDSPIPGIVPNFEMKIDEQEETTVLPFNFRKNEVSIYLFNNNGNLLIENFTYFLFGWLIIGIKKHINNTKHFYLKKIINYFHSIFVWNFVISYYLGVFMNYIFFDLIFLKFPATSSSLGKFNFALAILELLFIFCSLLFISLKIKQMHDKFILTIPFDKVAPTNIFVETANFIQTDKQLKFDKKDLQSEFKPEKSIYYHPATSELSPLFHQDSPNQAVSPLFLQDSTKKAESEKKYSNKNDISIRKEKNNSSQWESSKMSPLKVFEKGFTLQNSPNIADFNSPKISKIKSFAPRRWSRLGDLIKSSTSNQSNSINLEKKSEEDLKPTVGHSDNDFNSLSTGQLDPSRYSCLYDDLEHLNLGQSYFLMFDVFRQILISIMIALFYNIPIIALSAINFVNFEILILLIFIQPLKNRIDIIHTYVNEICINIACWSSFALAFMQDFEMGDANMRMNIGWIIIGANDLIMLAVVIRLIILVAESFLMIINLMKKYFKDRKKFKANRTKIYHEDFQKTVKKENELKIVEIQEENR